MEKIKPKELHLDSVKGATAMGKLLHEKIFLLKHTGVDSKIFQVWKSKGLVDFIERGKWVRLNLVEYLWLRVLETMRKFGCSVKLMKALYDDLFTKAFEEDLAAKNLKSRYDYYNNLSKVRSLTKDESELLEAMQYVYDYPQLGIQFRYETSYFSELVQGCLSYLVEAGLYIFEDETFIKFILPPDGTREEQITDFSISKPHLYIPLSNYILEFIADEEKDNFLTSSGLLNDDEYRVIKEIRNENVKSIKITFKENERKIEKIECDQKGLIKGDDAKKVMHLLGLKNYSGIELNTRDGKTLSFTYTEKKIF
ncbi:MAG: hypothetical protein IPN43_01620 [Chitinophagaceae bacterium]|nr:hypothetical protein [Chitinophagaceae bacterium]